MYDVIASKCVAYRVMEDAGTTLMSFCTVNLQDWRIFRRIYLSLLSMKVLEFSSFGWIKFEFFFICRASMLRVHIIVVTF